MIGDRKSTRIEDSDFPNAKKNQLILFAMESRRHYLRAESAAAAVDYAPEGLVPTVRQHVPFQPPPRTGTPPLHLATLPLAYEVVAPCLGVDMSYLKERGTKITCQTNDSLFFSFLSLSLPHF